LPRVAGSALGLLVETDFVAEVFFAAIRDLSRISQVALSRARCGIEAEAASARDAHDRALGVSARVRGHLARAWSNTAVDRLHPRRSSDSTESRSHGPR
jgi:hypothetical protein